MRVWPPLTGRSLMAKFSQRWLAISFGNMDTAWWQPQSVSAAHATLAQLFFCTTVSLAVFTSSSWIKDRPLIEEQGSLPLRYLCVAAATAIFLQLIIGATLRHSATWDQPLPLDLLLTHVGGAIAVTLLLGSVALIILW